MRFRLISPLVCAAALAGQIPIGAAPLPRTAAAAPPPLAQALGALPSGTLPPGLVLVVDPEHLQTGPTQLQSSLPQSLDDIAERYGLTALTYGQATALTSPTMVTLNPAPEALIQSPLGMPLEDALKVLLGSLTAEQLHDLGGDGLAVESLTDTQRQILFAALPHPLQVVPRNAVDSDGTSERRDADAAVQRIPDGLLFSGLHLRANLAAEYFFSSPDGEEADVYARLGPPPAPNVYAIDPRDARDYSALQSSLRMVVPNTLKAGDLRWSQSALSSPVSLDGLETVDELVRRIAQASGLELYCDPHYAAKPLLVFGQATAPVSCRDALRALCACLTATWRAVGPAYVLTDDRVGVAARRARLRDFVDGYDTRLTRTTEAMDAHLGEIRWAEALHFAPDDPGALPPALARQVAVEGDMNMQDRPFNTLPPGLQATLKANLSAQATPPGQGDEFDKRRTLAALGPDSSVEVHLGLRLFLDVPGFGTVQLITPKPQSYHGDVLPVHNVSPLAQNEDPDRKAMSGMAETDMAGMKERDGDESDSATQNESLKKQPAVMANPARLSVLCAPLLPADARAAVDRVAGIGMKRIYFAISPDDRAFDPKILNAGIAEGERKGVAVHAVLSALSRQVADPDAFFEMEDQAVTGETEAQALRRKVVEGCIESTDLWLEGVKRWINPADADARAHLTALSRQVAGTPGLAGLAFQDVTIVGYRPDRSYHHAHEIALGFDEAARLAFLRANGADPIDVTVDQASVFGLRIGVAATQKIDLSLPNFDAPSPSSLGDRLSAEWAQSVLDRDRAFLAYLYASVQSAAPRLPLEIRQRDDDPFFIAWTGQDLPPILSTLPRNASAVLPYRADSSGDIDAAWSKLRAVPPDAGLIFDLTQDSPEQSLLPTIERLAHAFISPQRAMP